MKRAALAFPLLLIAACSSGQDDTQVIIQKIAGKCNLPRGAFPVDANGVVSFRWAAGTPDADVACALAELKTSGIPKDKIGSTGREDRVDAR